jgi:hypothetical protein
MRLRVTAKAIPGTSHIGTDCFTAAPSPNLYFWKSRVRDRSTPKKSAPHCQRSAFVTRRGCANQLQQSPDRPRFVSPQAFGSAHRLIPSFSLPGLKLVRSPRLLAATLRSFTLITRRSRTRASYPSCVAVYPRDSRSRRVLCLISFFAFPNLQVRR